ncbi:hypothetical protein niasHS_017412 [Heterodera schachtii]|uniref:Uncharacterized protein n=1 Tax=Heterodera schachtii TaxID=97005 RepID=A0ABD2IGQ3_HETSC
MVGENTQQKINLAELLEVRSGGLTPFELLSVLSSSCDFLTRIKQNESPKSFFSLNQIFLTSDGRVEILLTSTLSTNQFIPPDPSEEHQNSEELNLVWCLGMSCLRVLQPAGHRDVSLSSLLNLMTVGQVQSRPTLAKVWQMVRNQIGIVQLAKVQEIISNLFKEVMGDLDELLADPFDDDIRFSSSRSSKISIIPGPGAPEQQMHGNLLASESTENSIADCARYELNSMEIPIKLRTDAHLDTEFEQHLQGPTRQPKTYESSTDEDGSTPRESTPIPKIEQRDDAEEEGPKEKAPSDEMPGQNGHSQGRHEPNARPIETERHGTVENTPQPQTHCQQKPTGRLYAKAGQIGKVPRGAVKKEVEIRHIAPDQSEGRLDDSFLDSADGIVSGFSPGTKRKVAHEKDSQRDETTTKEQNAQFQRKNSLEPSRCSKRRESGGRRTLPGTNSLSLLPTLPEFLSPNVRPIIRLRAQSMKRKKMVSLHRSDSAVVFVRLLNGHSVEVNCRTDTLIGSVFHTVAEHLNITEHLFFGLALQRQFGENIFLEEHQRLEKWAPPGWKGGAGLRRSFGAGGTLSRHFDPSASGGVEQFTLLLRFRYYPKKREFVKTANTAHQLYLQLRQDILSGTLRFSPKERAMEMAALALCAEANSMPKGDEEYFRMEDYMPTKFYGIEANEVLQTQQRIAERHRRLAASFGYLEAEEQFIARCQAEPLYGAHFYRVHKIKPKRGYAAPSRPFLSDTRIVAVLPSGIGICREERNGTQRLLNSTHEWHTIRTLQFDRKRFLLGTIEENIAVDHVFYTDHHSKASYLVRFAASQHRFMLKMRQWQGTLNRMNLVEWQKDVGVEQRRRSEEVSNEQQIESAEESRHFHARNTSHPQMGIGQKFERTPNFDRLADGSRLMFETEKEYIEYFYGSEAQRIDVLLEKDPMHGLGLTLIGGDMNGVKTVFVKSLSPEGDGKRKGLLVGDCLLSVNGVSLFNKSRHDAVQLVSHSAREVRLQLLRFPSVSEVLARASPSPPTIAKMDNPTNKDNEHNERRSSVGSVRRHFANASVKERREDNLRKNESTVTNESKFSWASGGTTNSISSPQKRQRAVSDFGASYLPALKTDDILALGAAATEEKSHERPQRYRRHKTSAGGFLDSFDSDSDSGDDKSGNAKRIIDSTQRGEYKPHLPSALSMYSFLGDEEEENAEESNVLSKSSANVRLNVEHRLRPNFGDCFSIDSRNRPEDSSDGRSPFASAVERFARVENATDAVSWSSAKLSTKEDSRSKWGNNNSSSVNLDWANCLSDVDGAISPAHSSSSSPRASSPSERKQRKFTLRIGRVTSVDSLPFKIRPLPGNGLFVSEVSAEKMLHCHSVALRVGDRIVAVDGMSVIGYAWEQVVTEMICGGPEKTELELTIERTLPDGGDQAEEQTLTVTLDKTQSGAIGLSLAKRMGSDGVFIRNIAPDSIAARDGTLRVGDRIWRVQGEQIALGESPANVVKRLKDLSGEFIIEVRRKA